MRRMVLVLLLVAYICPLIPAYADVALLNATAERYNGHDVGVVYINNEVVMRFYAAGIYPSPYYRAKEVVDTLTDLGTKGTDLSTIKVLVGSNDIVGVIGDRRIFRIYDEDCQLNSSTSESLANSWANNIKDAITLGKVDYSSDENLLVEEMSGSSATMDQIVKKGTESKPTLNRSLPAQLPGGILSAVRSRVSKVDHSWPGGFPFKVDLRIVAVVGTSFVLVALVLWVAMILVRKKQQLDEEESIAKRSSSEELENIVTHLISELEEKSARITDEFQEKIGKLESLLEQVDQKMEQVRSVTPPLDSQAVTSAELDDLQTDMAEPEDIVDQPIIPSLPPEEPKPAIDEQVRVAQHIERQHRTKQEIIYEMADQGRSVTDIAKKLGIGIGEVKLILDLKQ